MVLLFALLLVGDGFVSTIQSSGPNLIVNGDFESGNTAFSSDYTFSPGSITSPAAYNVVHDPLNAHPLAASYGDHTSGSGLMMAVNGATTSDSTVWSQTVPVTPNTDYQLSVWVASWFFDLSAVQLEFRISGESVGAFTALSTTGVWQQFAMTWNSGANVSAVIEVVDSNTNSSGNDFTLDDISFTAVTTAPTADAGPDQSLNEQEEITLDGSGSSHTGGGPLTYSWVQLGGSTVTLFDATTAGPTFTAPFVGIGGETLTFELTVTAHGETDTDIVNIVVVNVNHTPVADAGDDQSVAEGSPVVIDGTNSFDIDDDPISYVWVQESGPIVTVTGAGTPTLSFTAPVAGSSGAPGVVATLGFTLTVDDGFPPDAPPGGYAFADVADTVTIVITNVNNPPTADAGADQTVNENSPVVLNGTASDDPDNDVLTYAWAQISGPTAVLSDDATATPSLTVPFVDPGGADVTFELTVDDGYVGGTNADQVVVHVQNANDPPLVSAAQPTIACLWPPNHKIVAVGITGVSDPDDNAVITIDGVTQDEPTSGLGDGDTAVDAIVNPDGTVLLRAERSGTGDGRVYRIAFTASDYEGSASGVVNVCVPHTRQSGAVDGGSLYDSTN